MRVSQRRPACQQRTLHILRQRRIAELVLLGAAHDRDRLNSAVYPRSEAVGIWVWNSGVVPQVFDWVDEVCVVFEEEEEDVCVTAVKFLDGDEVRGFAAFEGCEAVPG